MKIRIKRDWFDPAGARRRLRDNPHTVPDSWEAQLPPGAEVIEEVVTPPPAKEAKASDKPK